MPSITAVKTVEIEEKDWLELRRLLKVALQGDFHEKRYAIQDAARIVGIITDGGFIHPAMMKAGTKPRFGDEQLREAAKQNPEAIKSAFYGSL